MIGRSLGQVVKGLAALGCTAGLFASVAAVGGAGPALGGSDGVAGHDEEHRAESDDATFVSLSSRSDEDGASFAPADPVTGSVAFEHGAGSVQAQAPARPDAGGGVAATPVPVFRVTVVARYPHDPDAFTQGLIWRDGALYESVGREGRSEVRRVNLKDGRVLARSPLPPEQFGEGLAANGPELVSLTWKNGVAYRWDARTLKRRGQWRYPGEGWGLAGNGRELALSDGTPALRFMDAATFAERRRVTVTFRDRPVTDLNELEWIGPALWGNIWHQPVMVRIDPATGRVTAVADLRPLVREVAAADPEAVANGIAADPNTGRLFVTGKLWPTLFEVKLAPAG